MILAIKIARHDLQYLNDIKDCMIHNSSNAEIEKIIVFSDHEIGVGIDSRSKKIQVMKMDIDHFEAVRYSCSASKDCVVYATPFIKFDSNLKFLRESAMEGVCFRSPDAYYVFRKDIKLNKKSNIDDILCGPFQTPGFRFQRMGYFNIEGFPVQSLGWKISKGFSLNESDASNIPSISVSIAEKNEYPSLKVSDSASLKNHKIDVLVVSVDYNDFLEITLRRNKRIFDRITVITSTSDTECERICRRMRVNLIKTDLMYSDGAAFNKGKAINFGLESLENPDIVLILDADIIVNDIPDIEFEDNTIYYRDRIMIPDYDSFVSESSDFPIESLGPIGYFQLFKYSRKRKYPENYKDAAWSDVKFARKFIKKVKIDSPVIHLGEDRKNWNGRITKPFFSKFDVNSYFDRIYCLNLDRREDRWNRTKRELDRFGIEAHRFSAIDGVSLEYSTDAVQDSLSDRGMIENSAALACLASHCEIIKDAKRSGYKKILIFEDDILISEDFHERAELLTHMEWSLFYLGASQFNWKKIKMEEGYYRCRNTLGTFAYAVDCGIYDVLIESFESMDILSVDNRLSKIQHMMPKKSFVFFPNIVVSDVRDSDIRSSKSILEYAEKVRWNLSGVAYKSISIIIPCYGHAAYLEDCVDSCLSQTVLPSKIVVLCMDADSLEVGNRIAEKSSIIEIVESEKMFLSKARNTCMEYVSTEYFIPLDADDMLPERFLEKISKIDSDVVYVGSRYFGAAKGTWPDPIEEEIDWHKLTTFRRNSLVCTALIKRDSFEECGMYNEDLWAFEDMDLWIRMHRMGKEFRKCFDTFLHYRKHSNSISLLSSANSSGKSRDFLRNLIMKDKLYSKTPKIVHWVWLGKKPLPTNVIDTWKDNLGDGWDIRMWNEDSFDMDSCEFLKAAYRLKKYGICVDYIRAYVLYRFGGVWLDADCVINEDISPFLQYDFFGSWENENFINIGLLGCSPGLKAMKNIMEYYSAIRLEDDVLKDSNRFVKEIGTGPIVLTNEILKIRDIRNGGFSEYFEHGGKRYLIETPDVFVLDDSKSGRKNFAVHLFDGSWTDKKEEWSVVVRKSYEAWKSRLV